jgi:hypothetical protein
MVQSRKPLVPWLAAAKGFWDPLRRCWNDEVGRMSAYISHRNQRLAIRKALKQRALLVPKAENDKSHQSIQNIVKHQVNSTFSGEGAVRPYGNDQPPNWLSLGHYYRLNKSLVYHRARKRCFHLASTHTCISLRQRFARSIFGDILAAASMPEILVAGLPSGTDPQDFLPASQGAVRRHR